MVRRYHPETNYICDLTGFKHPKSEMRMMWNGLFVHKSEWEPRQPQDFVKPIRPEQAVENARPDSQPVVDWSRYSILLSEEGEPLFTEEGQLILS